jgi:hypothetical protein
MMIRAGCSVAVPLGLRFCVWLGFFAFRFTRHCLGPFLGRWRVLCRSTLFFFGSGRGIFFGGSAMRFLGWRTVRGFSGVRVFGRRSLFRSLFDFFGVFCSTLHSLFGFSSMRILCRGRILWRLLGGRSVCILGGRRGITCYRLRASEQKSQRNKTEFLLMHDGSPSLNASRIIRGIIKNLLT